MRARRVRGHAAPARPRRARCSPADPLPPHAAHCQATAKLKAAEAAAAPGERATLASEAVTQLLRVPQVVPLSQMAPRLVFLRQWEVRGWARPGLGAAMRRVLEAV
jgi:hypothetical protein